MDTNKSSLERAFELARSGKLRSVAEIRVALKQEGYNQSQIEGRTLVRQLKGMIENKPAN